MLKTSFRQEKNHEYLKKIEALDQSPEIELEHVDFTLRKKSKLDAVVDKSSLTRPSKRAQNAIKSAAAVAASS